ncbi:hypothetical protein AMJ82_11030 [candidate division TA06 bacterium SM23_40]|uniref:Terminase large subunit gp17-like C-terminal domain-containing protein n=1 Tax=candidate division TA06 bacterium SM23_40 TaxID=1703774 RepID=A0A0S8G5M9_UNCT6|nr:MAG: hypothetical protein AMJ82_11030 [candidate division TA06 bacterium SM23_40]
MINMPPQHGKSSLLSHWLPTWYLEAFPEHWVIITSHEAKLAAHWGRKIRDTFSSRQQLLTKARQDVRAASRWYTAHGGGLIAAGVGGAITGYPGHLMIIDDPFKNWEQAQSVTYRRRVLEWFQSTFYTRAQENATMILIQTRWHQADLAGWLLKEHSDPWKLIKLPAIAEDNDPLGRKIGAPLCEHRFSEKELMLRRKAVGERVWAGMFQQRPRPAEGTIFKEEWLRYWDALPDRFDRIIQSWDMSFKDADSSSFVVGQIWGAVSGNYYLLDQRRDRLDFVATLHAIPPLSQRWPEARRKLVEDKANGPAIISALKSQIPGLIAVNPKGSKEARAQAVAPLWESGNVWIPNPKLYPWVAEFIDEVTTFPSSANDDQVDAMSQALSDLDDSRAAAMGDIKLPDLTGASPFSTVS